jgi:hypothetical protein
MHSYTPRNNLNTLWTISKPNTDLMSCWWNLKWLAFNKERHGANDPSKQLGIDKEIKVCRVEFNTQLYYYRIKEKKRWKLMSVMGCRLSGRYNASTVVRKSAFVGESLSDVGRTGDVFKAGRAVGCTVCDFAPYKKMMFWTFAEICTYTAKTEDVTPRNLIFLGY